MLETQYRNIEGCTSDLLRVPVVLPCEPQTIVPYVQGMKWHVHGYVWPTAGVVVFGLSITGVKIRTDASISCPLL